MKLYKIMTQEGRQYAVLENNTLISLKNGLSYIYDNDAPVDMTLDALLERQEMQIRHIRSNLKYADGGAYGQDKQEINALIRSNEIIKRFKK